ncbi:Uncharacterised protein [Mycobacterium tuberculosis]|nr:Uncharacterised protein [Mycobacterium tuberculosis]
MQTSSINRKTNIQPIIDYQGDLIGICYFLDLFCQLIILIGCEIFFSQLDYGNP